MEQYPVKIGAIPALLWGPATGRLLIAVHGDQSHKADTVIAIVADIAVQKGYQVLSFDLPQHGERKSDPRLCDAQNCVADLTQVMQYARGLSDRISVFGCSIGAYFALLAYREMPLEKTLFLSPIVDMKRLIQNMMRWFNVSEARLEAEQAIPTPINTLYWHYYQYVLAHPVEWAQTTAILYGEKDELSEYDCVKAFAAQCRADLRVLPESGHFFHTEEQLASLRRWLEDQLSD